MDKSAVYEELKVDPKNVRFAMQRSRVIWFQVQGGKGSHVIYKMDGIKEMLNFQNVGGWAKPYQVRRMLHRLGLSCHNLISGRKHLPDSTISHILLVSRWQSPSCKVRIQKEGKNLCSGALNSEYFIYAFTDWLNGDVFKVFLQRLIYKFDKLVAVIDQGPYHTSADVQKFYQENKEHLHIVYFPSYSPELDPIEQSWRAAKKWLAIRYWENKSELKRQLITAFEEGITMVPIYDCLRT